MRTALVTGANRGIGLETAKRLAADGHRIVLGVRDVALGEEARSQLPGASPRHVVLQVDVADPESIRSAMRQLESDGIEIDILVNNAGFLEEGDALKAPIESMDAHWRINIRGPWLLIQECLPGMQARGFGRIVNVSSGGGSFGEGSMMIGHAAYAVTKAALNALTVTTAGIVEGDVKVNAACPGWVRTRMGGDEAPRTVEEGADGIVWLATLDANGPHGGFYRDREPVPW
jgi:NAD(P)-dependent dehydrogenase (short-subunit alcohol dehydrogenase family)